MTKTIIQIPKINLKKNLKSCASMDIKQKHMGRKENPEQKFANGNY